MALGRFARRRTRRSRSRNCATFGIAQLAIREHHAQSNRGRRVLRAGIERGILADARQRMRGGVTQIGVLVVVALEQREQRRRRLRVPELAEDLRREELHACVRRRSAPSSSAPRAFAGLMSPRPFADCARTSGSVSASSFCNVGATFAFLRPSCVNPHTACRRASGLAGLLLATLVNARNAACRRAKRARAAPRGARGDRRARAGR